MNFTQLPAALLALAAAAMSQLGYGQSGDIGKREYEARCAVCHGIQGKGDGAYASMLNIPIPDLTTLSRRSNGVYPFVRIYEIIDGTQMIRAHGSAEMPIWGDIYKYVAGDTEPYRAEAFARARILALTEYVYRLQARN